jgi:hypothetical protein
MFRPASDHPDDVTVYVVVNDFGKFGRAFVETDIAEADRETVIRNFLSGQYSNALRVIAFNTVLLGVLSPLHGRSCQIHHAALHNSRFL